MESHAGNDTVDVVAFGAHPDDLEAVMGGSAAILVRSGMSVLSVDLCDGEPARHAGTGVRQKQAEQAASILGVKRMTLPLRDRLIRDSIEARVAVARVLRVHKPRLVFTTAGAGVHPDHAASRGSSQVSSLLGGREEQIALLTVHHAPRGSGRGCRGPGAVARG